MLLDINTYLGHYPFRRTPCRRADELNALMEEYGISKACVSSLPGVYYRDCMDGNLELFEEIAPYRDRFLPACTLNPVYPYAAEDFARCVEEFGCRMLKLFPQQQGYRLDGEESLRLIRDAAARGIPVQLPIIIEDLRQAHPMDIRTALDVQAIRAAAKAVPEADFVLTTAWLTGYAKELADLRGTRPGNIYYDTGRADCLYLDTFSDYLKFAGAEYILFGTGAPLQAIDVQLVKLHFLPEKCGLSPAQVADIAYGNAARLLKL